MSANSTSFASPRWRWDESPDNINSALAISTHFSRQLDAIVREGFQNASDGKLPGAPGPVRVTLTLRKVSRDILARYCGTEFVDRIKGIAGGGEPGKIRDQALESLNKAEVYVLVMEDFNTTGLLGFSREMLVEPNENFTLFMRSSGSGPSKGANKLGSWGLGKATLWFASSVRGIFAYSVRSEISAGEPQAVLMGRCLLPTAGVPGSKTRRFNENGYWGIPDKGDVAFTLPIIDRRKHEQFINDFGLDRREGQSGLSVVMPFFDGEPLSGKFCDELARVAAEEWALAIACGHLTVDIVDATGAKQTRTLDAVNIVEYKTTFKQPSLARVFDLVNRHKVSNVHALDYREAHGLGSGGAKAFVKEHAEVIKREVLTNGSALFKVCGIPVNLPSADEQLGHIYIMVTRSGDPEEKHTLQLYRNYLRIGGPNGASCEGSNWPGRKTAMTVGIDLWADDGYVAAMIRDGELPAHTGVAPLKSANFKAAHRNEAAWKFILNLPVQFEAALDGGSNDKDYSVFADIFPKGDESENDTKALSIDTDKLPRAIEGRNYKTRIRASGGQKPYTWAYALDSSSTLLPGDSVDVNSDTGVLTGLLTRGITIAVTLTDSAGTVINKTFPLGCKAPPQDEPSEFTIDDQDLNSVRVVVRDIPTTWVRGCVITFGYVQDGKSDSSAATGHSRATISRSVSVSVSGVTAGYTTAWSHDNGELVITWNEASKPANLTVTVQNPDLREDRQLVAKITTKE